VCAAANTKHGRPAQSRAQFNRKLLSTAKKEKSHDAKRQVKREVNGHTHPSAWVRLDEFLQYLVDPQPAKPLNEHWEQIYRLCQPCSVHYDFIGRYETMETDADHVLHAVQADHVASFPRRSDSYKHNKTSTYLNSAYKDIEPELLWQIYQSYEDDFEYFKYQIPEGLRELMKNGEAEGHV
jgi:hypothetical protein